MSKTIHTLARLAGSVVLLAHVTAYATPLTYTLGLIPSSGNVAGPAGSTIGWGYVIANQDLLNWLVTTNLSANPFANGTPDASFFDFPIVPPNTIVTTTFDSLTGKGLYGLTWDSTAPTGFVNSGTFTVSAEWWTGNPGTGGTFVQVAIDQTAAYSATVAQMPGTPIPEPVTELLLASSLGALWLRKKLFHHNA